MTSLMYHDLIQEKCDVIFSYNMIFWIIFHHIMLYILSFQLKFILLHIVSYSNLKTIKIYETPKIQYDIVLHDANVVASYDNMILYHL